MHFSNMQCIPVTQRINLATTLAKYNSIFTVFVCVFIYIYMCVCVCVFVYTHTHTRL